MKTFRLPSFALLLALTGLSPLTATAADGYAALQVPDIAQAVAFFRDSMNCDTLVADPTAGAPADSALLDCGNGNVLELLKSPLNAQAAAGKHGDAATSVVFAADDVAAASRWLRSQHVAVIGQPLPISRGPDRGKWAVDLRTPWGQSLQLIGSIDDKDLPVAGNGGIHLASD